MLGSIARKLRLFGFDTLYFNDANDEKLIDISVNNNRMLLTCDRALFQRAVKMNVRCVLLDGEDDVHDLAHICEHVQINNIEFAAEKSRCPVCNSALEMYDKDSAKDYVPDGVLEIHSKFYFCRKCRKAYWEGSHIHKFEELQKSVNEKLKVKLYEH